MGIGKKHAADACRAVFAHGDQEELGKLLS
jgi:hypothetical protein